jgi:N utilization substance protein B
MIRKKAREAAFQYLYQLDQPDSTGPLAQMNNDFRSHARHFGLEEDSIEFADRLAGTVLANVGAIDAMITKHARDWRVERLGSVEKSLLRLGVAELLYFKDVPAAVTLDEVIELAKKFAEAEAPAFLNGVLDPVSREPAAVAGKVASD